MPWRQYGRAWGVTGLRGWLWGTPGPLNLPPLAAACVVVLTAWCLGPTEAARSSLQRTPRDVLHPISSLALSYARTNVHVHSAAECTQQQ
jgi:hypothetical protein